MSLNPNLGGMFAGLPSGPKRNRAFASSFVLQAIGLVLLLELGLIRPAAILPRHNYVYIALAPPPAVNHAAQQVPPRLLTQPRPRTIQPAELAKVEPPKLTSPAEKLNIPQLRVQPVQPPPAFPNVASERPAPKPSPQVKTGSFSSGSSATPTANLDARKVQTGGFGDPNGIPAGNNTSGRVNIAALGSFDLPQGSGYGNGSGGDRGARAVVRSAGFGNGVATGSGGGASAGRVRAAGFGDTAPVAAPVRAVEKPKPDVAPVQILSKPTPAYTAEARADHIEGEVLLEVVFGAAGKVRVVRVVRGLGHGLDESAIRAAEQIRYKPATRGGSPVDFTATLHIVFQMA